MQNPLRPVVAARGKLLAAGVILACASAAVSGQTSDSAGEFWPVLDVHTQLPSNFRVLAFGGLKDEEDFPDRQWNVGAGLGYQWKRFPLDHEPDIDSDKENWLVTGVGYEHLRTIQSGSDSEENRVGFVATPRYRPPGGFLLEDRNRIEFRWVNGDYSTRYRNRLTVERALCVEALRFTPYASAEFFYEVQKSAWQKQQYAGGFRLPYRKILMVEIYYLRQDCSSCNPAHLNVAGLTLNLFFGVK